MHSEYNTKGDSMQECMLKKSEDPGNFCLEHENLNANSAMMTDLISPSILFRENMRT